MTSASSSITPESDLIRKAWRAGKKCVEINGKKFNIRKVTRKPSAMVSGELVKLTEHWLIARPTDGKLVPTYNVEAVYNANLRSKVPDQKDKK